MKRILFVLMLVAFTTGVVSAQQKEASITVADDSVTHDFGDIKEADGPVSHSFTVINNGELPLVISKVVASCGCTTPSWTQEPIAPGKTGVIKVTYDPTGRPNPFTKTVNVYSNGKTGTYVLTIRGNVIPK